MTTHTEAAAPPASRTYTSLRAAWIPMFALCLAFFVEMVDNTLLTIALPTIGVNPPLPDVVLTTWPSTPCSIIVAPKLIGRRTRSD